MSGTDPAKSDQINQSVTASVGTTSNPSTPALIAESGTDPDKSDKSDQTNSALSVGTTQKIPSVTSRKSTAKDTDPASVVLPVEKSPNGEAPTDLNAADDLLLSQYPWTKKATICLDRVTPLNNDIWTDVVHEYWCYEPDVGTAITTSQSNSLTSTEIDGYVLRSKVKLEPKQTIVKKENVSPVPECDIKTEELLKHA